MASQQPAPAGSMPSAQVVGSAFVQQFFLILHKSPDLVHRFYQESSKLGRPGDKGEMSTTSTLQAIDEKIMSMDYGEYRAHIKTVDAQESLNGGVLVLVTGYLIGKDNSRRDFAQTFFLATQDKGYYVLNDIFRYVEEADEQQEVYSLVNETDSLISPNHDTNVSEEHLEPEQTSATLTEDEVDQDEVYDPSELEEGSALDEELPVEVLNEVPSDVQPAVVDSGHSTVPEQKKSYASILKMMKENAAPLSSPTPAQTRAALANSEQRATTAHAPAASPALDVPASSSHVAESNNIQESEADGYSIYIKNLF
ncbi:hypothetical protein HPP92_024206 [Vanilla planifolia]|uniref:NTF2 domain-containing protein n=1 Tax=Vanilla planifolia TaxID=51239 RepID=A0A835U9Q0_VANPL|nr:hypothetical protein HPP92_024206 [Vanilla planifolia]